VICSAGIAMVMLSWAVTARGGFSESVTCTVKLDVPIEVGVPEMTPVLAVRVRPDGGEPVTINQEYGAKPPVAENVAL